MNLDIDRLTNLARGCHDAIKHRLEEIPTLEAVLADLEGTTCNGREYWRDQDHPTKTPKLYLLHSIGETCPLHGTPNPGDRLRVYVGSDDRNIADAREAMDREVTRKATQEKLTHIKLGLSSSAWNLVRFYSNLAYTVNDDGTLSDL